eukprot:4766839-Prymnesium_polylepis.2
MCIRDSLVAAAPPRPSLPCARRPCAVVCLVSTRRNLRYPCARMRTPQCARSMTQTIGMPDRSDACARTPRRRRGGGNCMAACRTDPSGSFEALCGACGMVTGLNSCCCREDAQR